MLRKILFTQHYTCHIQKFDFLKQKNNQSKHTLGLFKDYQLVEFLKENKLDYRLYVPTPLTDENEKFFELFDGFSVNRAFPKVEYIDFFWNKQYNNCVGQRIVVDADGSIMPCLYAKDTAYGNIFEENIRNVLREGRQDKHWDLIKDNMTGCKGCEYRYGCSADCMVASKNIKGDLNAKYPFCNYDPVNGTWKKI